MPGRPPVPTTLKLLNGTLNPTRANDREPRLAPCLPDAPAHLTEEERAAWSRLGLLLEPLRVLTSADSAAFEMLVVAYVHHQRLAQSLREAKALVYASKKQDGSLWIRQRPELAALADVGRRLLVLLGRFGLTPADRARLVQLEADGIDPLDEFA